MRGERFAALWMVSPALAVVLAVALYPVAYSVFLSLHEVTPVTTGGFVGLGNYADLFADPDFRAALSTTVVFTAASTALTLVLGLGVAVGIEGTFAYRGLARVALVLPWAFPTVVTAVVARLVLQDDFGIVAHLATSLGVIDGSVLDDRTLLLVAAVLADVWKNTPFVALILLAGLRTIPGEVHEAARVDGANAAQRFWRITLPLLRGALLVALLFRTLEAFRAYDLFWVLAERELDSLSTYVYRSVLVTQLGFAVGNAASVFVFVCALVLAVFFVRVLGVRASAGD